MNEIWQEERWIQRNATGKQLLRQSNTGDGDTLTSCMRCYGYLSPVSTLSLPHSRAAHRQEEGRPGPGSEYRPGVI